MSKESVNCYNCGYCETFENGVIRCFHTPKGIIKPCPYFVRKVIILEDGTIMPVGKRKHIQLEYRGIYNFCENI